MYLIFHDFSKFCNKAALKYRVCSPKTVMILASDVLSARDHGSILLEILDGNRQCQWMTRAGCVNWDDPQLILSVNCPVNRLLKIYKKTEQLPAEL